MGSSVSLPELHSFEVGTAKDGEGVPRRLHKDKELPTVGKHGVNDLYSAFALSTKKWPNAPAMGKRVKNADGSLGAFEWVTYATCLERIHDIGSGLSGMGLTAKDTFGLYAQNAIEYQLIILGAFSQGLVAVPIYDTLGDNIVEYETKHADLKLIFVDASKLSSVAQVAGTCPSLRCVVQIQPLQGVLEATTKSFEDAKISLTDLATLAAKGKEVPAALRPSAPEDLAFIMYTSGTTGDPKGVCIKQSSITVGSSWCAGIELYPTDRYLSYLPLAHIFETMVEHAFFSAGGCVGFYGGNIKLIQDDILTLKPTIFVGVPRVYQRFYDQAFVKIGEKGAAIQALLNMALSSEIAAVRGGGGSMWGPLLHKALGAKLTGGQVRLMVSGAAPLPVHVQEFLLAACGCPVVQGYGMTENCANATIAHLADWRAGHVGPPFPTTEIKLVDVPEMNYTSASSPPAGEVCTRSACTFAGYHKNAEETNKILEADGWLHTGDIGRWNADGTLSIIDRKKNIFKLAQGEYVAAEKIEMAISKSKYISQPWVYGNSFRPQLVAVITPDFQSLVPAAKEGGWFVEPTAALARKPEAVKLILAEIEAYAKEAKLKSFEVPKAVVLEGEINELAQGFSIQNDCLTPTFKLKRPQLLKRYQKEIDEMYTSLGEDVTKN